jgi:hypothetical protein
MQINICQENKQFTCSIFLTIQSESGKLVLIDPGDTTFNQKGEHMDGS